MELAVPFVPKRKRVYAKGAEARITAFNKKRRFIKGVDRTGGYYGRFGTPLRGRYSGMGGELKFHDVSLDDTAVPATGALTDSINLIAQGVTESTRVGRKCTIKSVYWKYTVHLPIRDAVATPDAGDCLRTIIYLDKQANGATAAITDVLETADIHGFRNLANQGRFEIVLDKLHNINYAGLASDGAGVVSQAQVINEYKFYKKCNIPLEFSSTTGVIGEIKSNNLGVLLISTKGNTGLATSGFRLRFSDGS